MSAALQPQHLLHLAAENGDLPYVQSLLAAGLDPTTKDADGRTPLHCAAQCGSVPVLRALLDAGAKKNVLDLGQATPIYTAAMFGKAEVVAALVAAGANMNYPGKGGCSPLFAAAKRNDVQTVEVLLQAGANPNTPAYTTRVTALWAAAQTGCLELVRALIRGGADLEARTKDGRTPLHVSAEHGHHQYDFPPTYMAERNHHPDCVEALRTALEARRAAAAAALVALRVEPSDTAADAGSADGAQHLAAPGAAKEQEPGVEPEPQKQRVEQSQEEHQAQEGQGLGLGGAAAAAPGGPEDSSAAGL
eukprot:XP_001698889.1 protein with ankyrin repeats [Chlamydomonas reinhardtii]